MPFQVILTLQMAKSGLSYIALWGCIRETNGGSATDSIPHSRLPKDPGKKAKRAKPPKLPAMECQCCHEAHK